jgi:hypothetical protein
MVQTPSPRRFPANNASFENFKFGRFFRLTAEAALVRCHPAVPPR